MVNRNFILYCSTDKNNLYGVIYMKRIKKYFYTFYFSDYSSAGWLFSLSGFARARCSDVQSDNKLRSFER